jgi:hypothetical protein
MVLDYTYIFRLPVQKKKSPKTVVPKMVWKFHFKAHSDTGTFSFWD